MTLPPLVTTLIDPHPMPRTIILPPCISLFIATTGTGYRRRTKRLVTVLGVNGTHLGCNTAS
jgi:hypothetical protein